MNDVKIWFFILNECCQLENSLRPGVFTPMSTRSTDNLLSNRLDQLRLTTQRVLHQKVELKNGAIEPTNVDFIEPSLLVPRPNNAARDRSPSPSSSLTTTDTSAERPRRPSSTNATMKPP